MGRDGESDSDRAARGRIDRRRHSYHPAALVECRAAGISLVYRSIDLNEIIIGACADVAAARRYDPGRYRAAEAVWIADGEHPIADLRDSICERDIWEVAAAGDLEQGDIGFGIGSDDLGLVGFVDGRLDFN